MSEASDETLAKALARDIEAGALQLHYQPKVDLIDGKLKGVEALARWSPADHGPIPPNRFIPLAEASGLIDPLTRWGLETALDQLLAWDEAGLETSLAFNLSALSLSRLDMPDMVERECRMRGLAASRLIMELTESATQPLINLLDTLGRFRIKGIGLSIDDFGTGYSTLMQLRQLPFTELKIDRFFVADAHEDEDSALITQSILDLAKKLGLEVTGEGVETVEQLAHLRGMGCDMAQGYLLGRPMDANALIEWEKEFPARWRDLTA